MKLSTMNGAGQIAVDQRASRLLHYLPAIYDDSEDDEPFLARFLLIFETMWQPLEEQIAHLYALFDPHLTPAELLPWLAQWVCLGLDEALPLARQRELVANMVDIYGRLGTAGAMRDYLRLYLGVEPRILDLADEAGQPLPPFHFQVRLPMAKPDADLDDRIRRIITRLKPAHTVYELVYDSVPVS
ncbi:MAG: hypothetical protein KIT87_28820 [Anaerolineae bacterium]|nr:hypothetical protein [Anaerolineae bacterium]